MPQGSVLGPSLYLLYINSLRFLSTYGDPTIYADDTCYLYHSENKETMELQVKNDLGKYLEWLEGSKLVINLTKTNYLIFKPTRKPELDLSMKFNNTEIERVQSTKYLGIILDEKLSWKPHIEKISKKVYPIIGAIRRCTKLPPNICNLVYNAHILSKIRPNLLIWSICNESVLNQVQVLMNRSLKALHRLSWQTPSSYLLKVSESFSLKELIRLERCKFVYKAKNKQLKCNIQLFQNIDQHNHFTRNRLDYRTFQSRTSNMSKGILNAAISEFNKLPIAIRNCVNIESFSKKLKLLIISQRI